MAVTADDLWTHLSGGMPTAAPPERVADLERVIGAAVAAILPHLTGVGMAPPSGSTSRSAWDGAVTATSATSATPLPADYTDEQLAALDTATLRAAAELWRWQQSSTGEYGYADGFDVPTPGYRDVFYTVQPLLSHAGLVNPAVVA
jgi:hypothetical protein